jgi:hypothetical protein
MKQYDTLQIHIDPPIQIKLSFGKKGGPLLGYPGGKLL